MDLEDIGLIIVSICLVHCTNAVQSTDSTNEERFLVLPNKLIAGVHCKVNVTVLYGLINLELFYLESVDDFWDASGILMFRFLQSACGLSLEILFYPSFRALTLR